MPDKRRDSLFEQALTLPPSARETFLARECADDEVLRAEVASLLAAHDAAEGFFESLARDTARPLQQSLGHFGAGTDDEPLAVGDTVAHYRVDARLGRGGMGVVYKATDTRLGRTVALKVLPASRATDARAREHLLEEARAASALDHPHIGAIFDVGTLHGGVVADRMYVAMAFYDGETLADRLARGPVLVAESLRIGRQLASALAAAHDAGLVHRDVKPSNVLLTAGGTVRLVDFGIAARVGEELPHTTAARGTRRYMSPERASGALPDPRADVWSLGLVLRDLLDARPARADSPIPEPLASLLHRCLDPDPERRPATAGSVLAALDAIAHVQPVAPPRVRTGAGLYTRPLAVAAAGMAIVLLVWFMIPRGSQSTPELGNSRRAVKGNRVLVLPLEDRTTDSSLAAFGALAADHVAEALAATSFAEAVPALTAFALARDGAPVPDGVDRLVHMAQPVGAAYVIAGSYLVQGDSLLVRAELSSGSDGRLVRTLQSVISARSSPSDALAALARTAVVTTALELDPRVRTDALLPEAPPNWEAYQAYARGKEHFLARRFDDALNAFGDAYARDSSLRFLLFYRGMVYVNTGRGAELEQLLEKFRSSQTAQTDQLERQALRVLESYARRDFPTIYRVHREAETLGLIGPGGLGHFSMGYAALEVGLPREAISIIRQSDPDRGELRGWPGYYSALCTAHLWLGENESALEAATRLQADHPALSLGPAHAVDALVALNRMQALDSLLDIATRAMPNPGALLRRAGNVLRVAGREAEARAKYTIALNHERVDVARLKGAPSVASRLALGESLLLLGELDEAEAIFRQLADSLPELLDPITSLGRIAAYRGDTAAVAAIDRRLTARAAEPWSYGRATYRRARLAAAQGNGARAAQLFEQAWREGFPLYVEVWSDPELARVRSHPAVRALMTPKG